MADLTAIHLCEHDKEFPMCSKCIDVSLYKLRGVPARDKEMTGPEKRMELARRVNNVQNEIRGIQSLFITMTPMAKQLKVWDELEKLMRAAEKVKGSFQELTL